MYVCTRSTSFKITTNILLKILFRPSHSKWVETTMVYAVQSQRKLPRGLVLFYATVSSVFILDFKKIQKKSCLSFEKNWSEFVQFRFSLQID